MFKNKELIRDWLNKYEVENYTINDDLTVDVDGDLDLKFKKIKSIEVQFCKVNGCFDCSGNQLMSLDGCPKEVRDGFSCSANQLTTLEGCPKIVKGNFNCSGNKLTNLESSPQIVTGAFYCILNKLITLEFCPTTVRGDFDCNYNPKLGALQDITDFSIIYKAHQASLLQNSLEKQIPEKDTIIPSRKIKI